MKHANLSPSKRHRWSKCPGSLLVQEERESNPYAEDGTLSHKLLEECIKAQESPFIRCSDEDRATRIDLAFMYVKEKTKNFTCGKVITEQEVSLFGSLGRWDLDGIVDIQIINNDEVEIIDYKDGASIVSATNNLQLQQYAAGVISMHPKGTFKKITLTIIQPRSVMFNVKPIRSQEYAEFDILQIIKQIEKEAHRVTNEEFEAGVEQCKFCSFSGKCKYLMNECFEILTSK